MFCCDLALRIYGNDSGSTTRVESVLIVPCFDFSVLYTDICYFHSIAPLFILHLFFPHLYTHPDEFIDLQYEENETKIIRFANYLRMVFQQPIPNADQGILEGAAKALGMGRAKIFVPP